LGHSNLLSGLERHHIGSLKALGPLLHTKLDTLSLFEHLVALHLDGGKVHKDVIGALARDETIALGTVKPLDCSDFAICHSTASFLESLAYYQASSKGYAQRIRHIKKHPD
jgi:hypothetical protein